MDGQLIFTYVYVPLAIGFCWFVITRMNAQFKAGEELAHELSMKRMAEIEAYGERFRHNVRVSLHGEPEVNNRRRDAVMATRAKRCNF